MFARLFYMREKRKQSWFCNPRILFQTLLTWSW